MVWAVISVALAVVLAVTSWVARRSRRTGGSESAPVVASGPSTTDLGDLPRFNVVALGPRGSGKTLLLASMYHQLQTASGRGYYVTAPYGQVVLLNQWFGEAADPELAWPSGTTMAETRTFDFILQTTGAFGRPLPVLGLNYLEYAGGLLTDAQAPGSTAQADLLGHIGNAHALIGIIDGFWLRKLIDGDQRAKARMQQTMTTMIGLMMSAECPITFVITKWDLLRDVEIDEDARLGFACKHLMHNQGFRDLVSVHSTRRVIRLIPVSAVGPDFAELDDAGLVSKRADGEICPKNIDVPLAAVVPDLWEQIERSVGESELRTALARLTGKKPGGHQAALADLAALVNSAAARFLGVLNPAAGMILDLASSLHRGPELEEVVATSMAEDRRLTDAEREFELDRAARRRVLRQLQSRVDVFEGRLPSSRLSAEI